jgi:hypothetical protein
MFFALKISNIGQDRVSTGMRLTNKIRESRLKPNWQNYGCKNRGHGQIG